MINDDDLIVEDIESRERSNSESKRPCLTSNISIKNNI